MDLDEIVQTLIKEGKITQDDLVNAEKKYFRDKLMKSMVDEIHTKFCNLNHDSKCNWYDEGVERTGEEMWEMPTHSKWIRLFNSFLNSTQLPVKTLSEEPAGSTDYRFTPR